MFNGMKSIKRATWPFLEHGILEPMRYGYATASSALMQRDTVSLLLLSDGIHGTSEQQYAPILRYRSGLNRNAGIRIRRKQFRDITDLRSKDLVNYDIVGLKLQCFIPPLAAARIVETVRLGMRRDAKLVYFDGDDDLTIAWPDLVEFYDLYVKKHTFRDRRQYLLSWIGKNNLTDYVARNFGVSFENDSFPFLMPVPSEQIPKIVTGWNIGFDDKIARFARRADSIADSIADSAKGIDVICRAGVPSDWIQPLRLGLQAKLSLIGEEFNVRTARTRVSQEDYNQEMMQSRICVSPFGYGEICWRDFEAILGGCVLVKPDMSHVETYPNIFVPGVTYQPVDWDYSNLETVVRQLLADPARCETMRTNARLVLMNALGASATQEKISTVLNRVYEKHDPDIDGDIS